MSDFDGLHLCSVCGDAYTTGDLCTSCAWQAMIDRAETGSTDYHAPNEPPQPTAPGRNFWQVENPIIGDWVTLKTWEMPRTSKKYNLGALTYPDRLFQVAEIYESEIRVAKHVGPDFPPVNERIPRAWVDVIWRKLPE